MMFRIFSLIIAAILPVTFIAFGKIFSSGSPKEINGWFGYRTSMSMKNKDTWLFAHKLVGKLWFTGGLIFLPVSLIPVLIVIGKPFETICIATGVVCGCHISFIIFTVICTETALRKRFHKDGEAK